MIDRIKALYVKYKEIINYIIFGGLTTVVSFLSAAAAKWALERLGAGDVVVSDVSTVISWICAVTFSYVTNRKWVFESRAHGFSAVLFEAAKFYGGRVFTLVLETVIMDVGNGRLSLNYWAVKIAANVVILILNYVISKLIVFRKKK